MIGELRAWHTKIKEYVRVDKYCFLQHNGIFAGDCILEQFTGIYDKNGVKIFEGDIVMWGGDVVETVSFSDCMFQTESSCIDSCMTVIGNIHQNTELLEQ